MGECGYGSGGISVQVLGTSFGPQEGQGSLASISSDSAPTLLGLVCGQTTMTHIAFFARMYWPMLKEPLGFVRDHPPHATTISRTLAGVSHEQLQGALTGWVAHVVGDQELKPRWTASGPNNRRTLKGIRW